MATSKANTYRAVLVGLAIIIIASIGYFIYRAVVGTKKVVETTVVQSTSSALGSGQSIRENAPISNTAAPASTQPFVPVGNGSGAYETTVGTSNSGGTVPNGTDTANYGPANGTSPCNAYGSLENPTCQKQQVYPK
jgi:hypothetical protein